MLKTTSRFAVFLGGMLIAGGALAQAWPAKAVTFVIPFPPGSGNDIIGRVVGAGMSPLLGQPVIIDNRAGAASNIGMEFTAKSAPDGYTLAVGSTSYGINIYTQKGTLPLSAYTPVALLGKLPFALVVNPQLPAKSVPELIKLVRSNKGKYNAAAGGATGSGFFMVESFKRFVGPELELVVYKGTPEAEADLISGRVHMVFTNMAGSLQHYRSGKLRFLGVAGAKRNELAPDVATFTEQGFPQFDVSLWYALMGPAGIPRPVVARLNEAANKAMGSRDVIDKLKAVGVVDAVAGTPENVDAFLKQDSAMWAKAVKESGIALQ